ncbi:SpoIIIAH-like family protein [Eubacteriales bacterium OttesenSCG-928-K08]|nr:SpoIIIAH-like family protein [Eubacteriales bacterium OttesenSCG-928-K08]
MKKKYGVLVGIVAFLALVVFINAKINQAQESKTPLPTPTIMIEAANEPTLAQGAGAEDYFESLRINRQSTRDTELEVLDAIILHEQVDEETLTDAQQQKLAIVDNMEKEFTIEALLIAKGFEDVAVIFHPGAVNVIIKANELTEQQVAQVLDIVCRETGESATNIKVSTSK